MTITISYSEYANEMNKCFRKVSYNAENKTVTIDLSTGGIDFDPCYSVLCMDDQELLSMVRANKVDATIEEAHAAIEDTITQMVTMYHSEGYKAVTAGAIKAAAKYIRK